VKRALLLAAIFLALLLGGALRQRFWSPPILPKPETLLDSLAVDMSERVRELALGQLNACKAALVGGLGRATRTKFPAEWDTGSTVNGERAAMIKFEAVNQTGIRQTRTGYCRFHENHGRDFLVERRAF
jgi:hypothetical protein